MSNALRPVWDQVVNLLDQQISVIPVRDRDEYVNGKLRAKKTPFESWERWQNEIVTQADLFAAMQKHDTTAVAMVCGRISGNLIVIDIDVKYKSDAAILLFNALKDFYPELLNILRIHKTPSGGYHIIYRIEQAALCPGSSKIANRPSTEQELSVNPKSKTKCFIEMKAEGGLCTAPPSIGYAIRKNVPIPVLLFTQHEQIINVCKSFNEVIEQEKPFKVSSAESNYYSENPFEHYNRTVDEVELLEGFGWTCVKKNGIYKWFTKPGGRKGEVHCSFNTHTRCYKVFTTNCDLEERGYMPASILAHYGFNNDKSATYHHLVNIGYGRIKPAQEALIVRRNALSGQPMPGNASPQAVEQYNVAVQNINTAYPHGIFWHQDDKGIWHISRERLYSVSHALGFRVYMQNVVQIVEQFIYKRTEGFYYDALKEYIHDDDPDLYEAIQNAYEAFLQKSGKFSISRLRELEVDKILKDTRFTCYKCFLNGVVKIEAKSYELLNYTQFDRLVWFDKVQARNFKINTTPGLYVEYLKLAVDLHKHTEHVKKCIGYLAHDYKDESTGYIIVLTEQCTNPKDGGGAGKNLFGNLLSLTTSYTSVPGSQVQLNEKFLQSWDGERIFCISDAHERFNFGFLKDLSTGKVLIKKLFKDEKTFSANLLPKIIVNTNFTYEIEDGGLDRRIIHIEFTDFFTKSKGVKKHFGKVFPNDWSEDDFNNHDTFICECIMEWINGELELNKISLSETGWEKQFQINNGTYATMFIKNNWEQWKNDKFISNEDFNKQLDNYMIECGISINSKFRPSGFKINKALKEWCKKCDYDFTPEFVKRDGLNLIKGRRFLPNEAPF